MTADLSKRIDKLERLYDQMNTNVMQLLQQQKQLFQQQQLPNNNRPLTAPEEKQQKVLDLISRGYSYWEATHYLQEQQNNQTNQERELRNQQRAAIAAEQEEAKQKELEEVVKKERPDIWTSYYNAIAECEKSHIDDRKLVEKFFNLSKQDINDYLHLEHDISESVVQLCMYYNKSMTAPYKCTVDGFNCFTLEQMEEHIYSTTPHEHKEDIFRQLEKTKQAGLADIKKQLKEEIEEAGKLIQHRQTNEANRKRIAADKARDKRLREKLPLVTSS